MMRIHRGAWLPLLLTATFIADVQPQIIRSSCGIDDFRCDTGRCIESSRRCDRVYDCPGREDERNCECSIDEFRCESDGSCIEERKRCDNERHCADGSDELNCDSGSVCPLDQFACNPGSKTMCATRCDGNPECDDGEDENDCADCSVQCRDGTCVPSEQICDSIRDCPDGEDELDCDNCDKAIDFRCTSGTCISRDLKCNDVPECPDGSDELDCNSTMSVGSEACPDQFQCVSDKLCINYGFYCDGNNDCLDGSDEANCQSEVECSQDDSFQCRTGGCIPTGFVCDGRNDCRDGSDEEDCRGYSTTPRYYTTPGRYPVYTTTPSSYPSYGNQGQPGDRGQTENLRPYGGQGKPGDRGQPGSQGPYGGQGQPGDRGQSGGQGPYGGQGQPGDRGQAGSQGPYGGQGQPGDRGQAGGQGPYGGQGQPGDRGQPGSQGPYGGQGQPGDRGQAGGQGPYGGQGQPGDRGQAGGQGPYGGQGQYGNRPGQSYPSSGPAALSLRTYPQGQTVRHANTGGDVVFQCRDEGPERAPVRWVREGGRPIKPGSTDVKGRLEMFAVKASDAGVYICQAPGYLKYPGSEMQVTLVVDTAPITYRPPFPACQAHEATCGNGDCIPKRSVCDGTVDCSDRSDEENCQHAGFCEPNQFKCNNGKCVLKTWVCDSENDCGDSSDERDCGYKTQGSECSTVEFSCRTQGQCVPKSYHCDGQSDCFDGSDEIGCAPVHVHVPPTPSTVRLNPGDTLILRCEAVGVPTPLISWRLNWGHVPSQCTSTSVGGVGVLTCGNMQPAYNGAYSCEAIQRQITSFAVPDAIVIVNKTDLCPQGYFNNEARSEEECIRCFCFGESTQCRSADLFTYNMPTPLGEGGTLLKGVKVAPSGDIEIDSSPITNQYYYQPLRNGATVTKLAGNSWSWSDSHPYLTLPETYNGNQLTSYGGHIKYTLSPQTPYQGQDNSAPTVIIKGKYATLIHSSRASGPRSIEIEARLTPENWMKSGPRGVQPASREDIMMALDDIELILLRADYKNAGVNISDFAMESAQHINVGLGAASLVEECTCPQGYEGLSCQKCASGYIRKKIGPWLGNCVPEDCPAGTFGNPSIGIPCKPCPCPLTNRENQFAGTCSLGPDGSVICDCYEGYEGQRCEMCAPGYEGNPIIPGNSCVRKPSNDCNPIGTRTVRLPDECVCKDNVQGRYCEQCKDNAFFLSEEFRHGCAQCFCSGVSSQCKSSNYRRNSLSAQFNVPQIVNQVKVYKSAPSELIGPVRYTAPVESDVRPELVRGDLTLNNVDRSRSSIYYWSMPDSFAGDKVTSYGGYLHYTLKNVPTSIDPRTSNNAADVQLISDNQLTLNYVGNFVPSSDGVMNVSIQFLEKGWQRPDGKEVPREHLLLALADVKTILIKATYSSSYQLASPVSASIDIAEPNGYGPMALQVEQCTCPPSYIGTSCEDCAPGYTRSSSGLYLEHCEPCECNGKSNMCNPETGVCYDCAENTDGEQCENCKPGYDKDEYGNCVSSRPLQSCNCDPRGTDRPCDASGNCYCKQNVEGESCDRCRPGTFGMDQRNPTGCLSCFCSGVTTDCHEGNHYGRLPMAAPILSDNYGGYTITDLPGEKVIKDDFVPQPGESELMYTFQSRPDTELYWSLPIFPGNRVLSYGGSLSLRQKFSSSSYDYSERGTDVVLEGDSLSLYWTNPNQFRSGESFSYQVPLREEGWFIRGTSTPATRANIMNVLRNLKRVLVRATVVPDLYSTTIADVSMDTAAPNMEADLPAAKGIEVCICPPGYSGTSCETCASGFYKDSLGYCVQCPCSGFDCQLDNYGQVVCNCEPPYKGPDCSTIGGDSQAVDETTRYPIGQPTVIVTITRPNIKIQKVGSSVNFTCQAQSINTRTRLPVRWSKSDGELPQGRSQVDENIGLLLITNLQVYDSGTYICETSDGYTTEQAMATLTVAGNEMTEPVVELNPVMQEYYEGDRIELSCNTRGNPTPTISWLRGFNRPLPLNALNYGNLLIIEPASVQDTGEYTCVATNPVGASQRTAVIKVLPRPSRPIGARLTVSNISPSVSEGQSIRIVCTGSASVPAGSIDWVRQDNARFMSNVQSENGVLFINTAIPENQGVYICQSIEVQVDPIPVQITVVHMGPPTDASNITVSVNSLQLPTGGSGSVDCNPTGRPQPRIKWTKMTGSLSPRISQRGNTLIINGAQEDDEDYYKCEGTVNGNVVANIHVYVRIEKREKPSVDIWPSGEQAVRLGVQHELHCRVLGGVPAPEIMWERSSGRPLSRFAQIRREQNMQIITFSKVEVNDEGEYRCTATNIAGAASASAVIKVRSPPEITITPDFLELDEGDPINVECRATNGYPEPMVSIRRQDDRQEVVPPTPGYASLRVSRASALDDGEYVCTASNLAETVSEQFVIRVNRGDGGDGGDDGGAINEYEGSGDEPSIDSGLPPERPQNLIAFAGQPETRIYCNTTHNARWSRANGEPLQRNAAQYNTLLIIYNISKSDAGEYVCNVYNEYDDNVQQAAYTQLVVVAAPSITLRPPNQTVYPGESPTVECVVEGDDIIDIIWRPVRRAPSSRVDTRTSTLIFHQIEVEDAGEYECFARSRYANASATAAVYVSGTHEESQPLVSISKPQRRFRPGDNVEVHCKTANRESKAQWERPGTNQFVASYAYGNGAVLVIQSVTGADAGLYRCSVTDGYGRLSFDEFTLEVESAGSVPNLPTNVDTTIPEYRARLRDSVELPCKHNLEAPVNIEWRREFSPLSSEVRANQPILRLYSVKEEDAGTYVCRVSNNRASVEARAILVVTGVVPQFNGQSFLSLPTLKEPYRQFDIEISFKPSDANGLILYNSENQGREGDYIALQLMDGIPEFTMETGTGPLVVNGDRPLQLNAWHTIRLSRINSKVTMDVDNSAPIERESEDSWGVLDLKQPMFIGGVPDIDQLPATLAGVPGYIGCVSMLVLGSQETNIMLDSLERNNVTECDTCAPNLCLNNGVCQAARNERGYMCMCASGFAGLNCDRTGEACRPGLCGPGKCSDTVDGYKCACPVTRTGKNCEKQQSIEYPAFTGSAFLAIKAPPPSRTLKMSMNLKANAPVIDGIIVYAPESSRGYGGFTSLAVRNGKLEFRYDLGRGSKPVVLVSNRTLPVGEWTIVNIARVGHTVSLKINMVHKYEELLDMPKLDLNLENIYVGGVDDSITLNKNIGVTGGFNGCIKEFKVGATTVDIMNDPIKSANIQECSTPIRGDIPDSEAVCQCRNGGVCSASDPAACLCPPGFGGQFCEQQVPATIRYQTDPCASRPCRNGGTCRPDASARANFSCDCPLGFAGAFCQMPLELFQSVGFNGNGYLELPSSLMSYAHAGGEPAVIALAIHTTSDGVLLYQKDSSTPPYYGDYILLRIERGIVVLDWDTGSGKSSLSVDNIFVNDGERHQIIAKLQEDGIVFLSVDNQQNYGNSNGFSNIMDADSNIYIGGIPEILNQQAYPGFSGCIEQLELMSMNRGVNLGASAVAGRNTQRCKERDRL